VDKVVVFRQLQKRDIRQIVDIILAEVNRRLVEHELVLEPTDAARDWLGENGYDAEFGARPLRRLIQTEIEDQLSDLVLAGEFKDGEDIIVDAEDGKLILRHKEGNEETDEVEEPVTPL
jgi:ATP-dependent Clp protease ATP-binding subunit ClpC